jgi:hypothetical protein
MSAFIRFLLRQMFVDDLLLVSSFFRISNLQSTVRAIFSGH